MSKFNILSYPNNYRVHKAQIAAAYCGVELKEPGFNFGVDNLKPEFLAKSPMGKVPVLETPSGAIFESNAIARYIAGFRADKGLLGDNYYDSALVAQWVDFSANEVENPRAVFVYPPQNIMKFNQHVHDAAVEDMNTCLSVLNNHLLKNQFMVGNHVTLADITLVCALNELYQKYFSPSLMAKFGNVTRWFNLCINQPEFIQVLGKVVLNKVEAAPTPAKNVESKETKGEKPEAEKVEKAGKGGEKAAAEKPVEKAEKSAAEKPTKEKKDAPKDKPKDKPKEKAAQPTNPEIDSQAAKVRSLKDAKAPKEEVEAAIKILLELKAKAAAEAPKADGRKPSEKE
jgi:elongation factor 1-gamma